MTLANRGLVRHRELLKESVDTASDDVLDPCRIDVRKAGVDTVYCGLLSGFREASMGDLLSRYPSTRSQVGTFIFVECGWRSRGTVPGVYPSERPGKSFQGGPECQAKFPMPLRGSVHEAD